MTLKSTLRRLSTVAALSLMIFFGFAQGAFAANTGSTTGTCTSSSTSSTTSGSVSDGGISSCINSVRSSMFIPIVIAIAGIAVLVGGLGAMFRPDKKEMFTMIAGIACAALLTVGASTGVMAAMQGLSGSSSTASGVLIR